MANPSNHEHYLHNNVASQTMKNTEIFQQTSQGSRSIRILTLLGSSTEQSYNVNIPARSHRYDMRNTDSQCIICRPLLNTVSYFEEEQLYKTCTSACRYRRGRKTSSLSSKFVVVDVTGNTEHTTADDRRASYDVMAVDNPSKFALEDCMVCVEFNCTMHAL
jgi:hypothetical protein